MLVRSLSSSRGTALKTILGLALVVAVAGPAGAQPGTTAPPPPVTGAASDAQVGFQRRTYLTPQEESVEADRSIARMEGAATGIRTQLEKARQQRDVVKTLCLNDKLSQADVALRSARDRSTALKSAVQRGDSELANHEFTILTVLRQRSDQLTAEANQCIGEESAFVGETNTLMEVDPNLPVEDTTTPPPDQPIGILYPPPCASCYR